MGVSVTLQHCRAFSHFCGQKVGHSKKVQTQRVSGRFATASSLKKKDSFTTVVDMVDIGATVR